MKEASFGRKLRIFLIKLAISALFLSVKTKIAPNEE